MEVPAAPQRTRSRLSDDDVKMLDDIWKEMNAMTGRRNLGARLFNVSSMLSNFVAGADRKQTVLQLVNYSGFPVENVTVHVLGKFKSARLLAPGAPNRRNWRSMRSRKGRASISTTSMWPPRLLRMAVR